MMLGLIKKDLFLIKGNLKSLLIIFIVFIIMSFQGSLDIAFIFPMICIMLFISTFSYDEYNKWNAYAVALPNGRKNVVKSKYFATLILVLISTIIMSVVSIIMAYTKEMLDTQNIVSMIMGSVFSVVLLESIMYPLIFKYGVEKGRIGVFIGVFIITTIFGIILPKLDMGSLDVVTNLFSNYWYIILPLSMIVMFYISYIVSVKIYKNKEF